MITSYVINQSNALTCNYAVNTHITLPFFALKMKKEKLKVNTLMGLYDLLLS